MSYLVLARKWRPANFDQVIGQTHVTQTLKNAIELNRVAHALLFTGSRGIGKTSCARILAKALNCQTGPTVDPCGTCPSCSQITGGTSVDVFEIDGASNNSVEQIREIRESVKFMPANGRRKIYIIDEVHMLSTSAFNALLKTLEEPPEHVLFIFATTEPHKIPDTIISRCQRYDFKRIAERTIVDALIDIAEKEGLTADEAALFHVAREAQGGMRDSLSLLDQVIAYCGLTISEEQTREILGIADRSVFGQLVDALLNGQSDRALSLIDAQYRRGLDLQKFAAEFVRHIRDLLVIRVVNEAEQLVDMPTDQIQVMAQQVGDIEPGRLHRMFNIMLQGAEEISRSSFPKLSLEMVLLRICQQGTTLPIADVLQGLAQLESQLANKGIEANLNPPLPVVSTTPQEPDHQTASSVVVENAQPVVETMIEAPSAGSQVMESDTKPPWEPSPASTSARAPEAESELAAPDIQSPVMEPTTSSDLLQSAGEQETDIPASTDSAVDKNPSVEVAPPSEVKVESGGSTGFKKRPDGVGEYDDLSGNPPVGQPIDSLRPLAVKPRTHLAIPKEEVRPFLVSAAAPPSPTRTESEDHSPTSVVRGDSAAETPKLAESRVIQESIGPVAMFDFDDGIQPIERFTNLLDKVQSKDAFLGSELTQCLHLVQFDATGLLVAVTADHWRTIGDTAEVLLRTVVQHVLGSNYMVTIEICERQDPRTGTETVFERKQRLAHEHRDHRRSQARQDSQILRAQQALKAEIVDVQLMSVPEE